jgi:hypothetical protein
MPGSFACGCRKALGGPELSPLEFMGVVEAAAELDGSCRLAGNAGGMSRVAGYLPETVAGAWFDDRRAFLAGATGAVGARCRSRAVIG